MENIKILDFYANWCGPCRMLSPIIDELKEERGFTVIKIDIDSNEEMVRKYQIMSVPTLVLLKNDIEIARHTGYLPKEALLDWINENI